MNTTDATGKSLIAVRQTAGNRAAIVFIHGFIGDVENTWQKFPALLAEEPTLKPWDIWLLGYPSRLTVDVLGLWAADPGIDKLGDRVATDVNAGLLANYEAVGFIAHSMGGLVTQRALLNSPELAGRTSHVVLFGTPSGGLKKASWVALLKPALRDMAEGGAFIDALRGGWAATFDSPPERPMPFKFVAAAGERDEFVPASSALGPFRDADFPERVAVVPGNHIQMVKPDRADSACVRLVVNMFSGNAAAAGPLNSASVAVELNDFRAAIAKLEPQADSLDAASKVQLAIALDRTGRREDAIQLLRRSGQASSDTDAMGTLAGRLKRRWLAGRLDDDGREALALYRQALALSRAVGNVSQAFYQGINVAFLELAYLTDFPAARATARQVLADCRAAAAGAETVEDRRWRLATEADALLLMNDVSTSLQRYREALRCGVPRTWQVDSMHQQALHLSRLLGEEPLMAQVDTVFHAPPKQGIA